MKKKTKKIKKKRNLNKKIIVKKRDKRIKKVLKNKKVSRKKIEKILN